MKSKSEDLSKVEGMPITSYTYDKLDTKLFNKDLLEFLLGGQFWYAEVTPKNEIMYVNTDLDTFKELYNYHNRIATLVVTPVDEVSDDLAHVYAEIDSKGNLVRAWDDLSFVLAQREPDNHVFLLQEVDK